MAQNERLSFRSLLSEATGKSFEDIGENDVREWAASQGFKRRDVNRVVRGFNKFSKRPSNFTLTSPGEFQVSNASTSGRRTGNVKGFDMGDLIGLGKDVSTLAGALGTVNITPKREINEVASISPKSEINTPSIPNLPTPVNQRAVQEIGVRNQEAQKNRPPKQRTINEGPGEIATGPNESFPVMGEGLNFLDRSGLGLLNNNPNDFGGNIRLGDTKISEKAELADGSGFSVNGLRSNYGKDEKGFYKVVVQPDGSYTKGTYVNQKKKPGTYNQIKQAYLRKDDETVSQKATQLIQSIPDRVQSLRESAQEFLFRPTFPNRKRGGKLSKFSRI